MSCPHDLDAEFMYPSDPDVLEIYEGDGGIRVTLALACPEFGEPLEIDASVESVEEGDFELPLDDDLYD